MILKCNSCEKKFVVPDQAITAAGRTVQCGSCGNKWKQFPNESGGVNDPDSNISKNIDIKTQSSLKKSKSKKKKIKKTREVKLYSPEYLANKHGINLNNEESFNNNKSIKNKKNNEKVSFGFYNLLIVFVVVIIALSKSLHYFQFFLIKKLPFTEFYLNYFFENIRNIFNILKNLISSY
jgi:predicted Zn finger-like uncharacterized protein